MFKKSTKNILVAKKLTEAADEFVKKSGMSFDEIFYKGRGASEKRIRTAELNDKIPAHILNKTDYAYKVFYGNGGNAYNIYINKDIANVMLNYYNKIKNLSKSYIKNNIKNIDLATLYLNAEKSEDDNILFAYFLHNKHFKNNEIDKSTRKLDLTNEQIKQLFLNKNNYKQYIKDNIKSPAQMRLFAAKVSETINYLKNELKVNFTDNYFKKLQKMFSELSSEIKKEKQINTRDV